MVPQSVAVREYPVPVEHLLPRSQLLFASFRRDRRPRAGIPRTAPPRAFGPRALPPRALRLRTPTANSASPSHAVRAAAGG